MQSHEVDAGWLTRSLRPSLGTSAEVRAFTATSIGTGQVGENVRFELRWSDDDPGLPASVVGKFPSTSEASRAAAVQTLTYVKEIGFYRDLQHAVTIRTPAVHSMEWEPVTHDFVVVMEDVRHARQGDQLRGCTVEDAELAVDQAVGLHAPTWGRSRELLAYDWLGEVADPTGLRAQLLEILTPGFVSRYEERLAPEALDLAMPLARAYSSWSAAVKSWAEQDGDWCVVHGDYRLDNMLFGSAPGTSELTVVDWQTAGIGIGPADIAYFCGAGLLPDTRVACEGALVARYAAALRGAGVAISDDAVWEGYVLGSASGYFMAVLASQIVERTARGDEMFAVMAERHAHQIRSVGLPARLGLS
jgi:hypothetical protein